MHDDTDPNIRSGKPCGNRDPAQTRIFTPIRLIVASALLLGAVLILREEPAGLTSGTADDAQSSDEQGAVEQARWPAQTFVPLTPKLREELSQNLAEFRANWWRLAPTIDLRASEEHPAAEDLLAQWAVILRKHQLKVQLNANTSDTAGNGATDESARSSRDTPALHLSYRENDAVVAKELAQALAPAMVGTPVFTADSTLAAHVVVVEIIDEPTFDRRGVVHFRAK